jgi:hypothetical protein
VRERERERRRRRRRRLVGRFGWFGWFARAGRLFKNASLELTTTMYYVDLRIMNGIPMWLILIPRILILIDHQQS